MKKEIAFIDHNFHKKSKSADFFKENFEKKYKIKNYWWSLKDQYQLINKVKKYDNFFFFSIIITTRRYDQNKR